MPPVRKRDGRAGPRKWRGTCDRASGAGADPSAAAAISARRRSSGTSRAATDSERASDRGACSPAAVSEPMKTEVERHPELRRARCAIARRVLLGCALLLVSLSSASRAEPVRARIPEGPAHGFIALSDLATGKQLAQGELLQKVERRAVVSRLVIRFDDGSLYDETVRFSQRPTFRVLSYKLLQKGPAFKGTTEVEFERSGRYSARVKEGDEPEKKDSGTTEIPEDVSNGLTSVVLKNLQRGETAETTMMTFLPEPLILKVAMSAEGEDDYWVGATSSRATRYLIEPSVEGVKGVLATVTGKQPPSFRMWISREVPVLVRFEGPLYADGPPWRIELSGPAWKKP